MDIRNTSARFVRDTIFYSAARAFIYLRSLFIIPAFVFAFGVEQYGVFTQCLLLLSLLQPIIMCGMDTAVVRYLVGVSIDERLFRRFSVSVIFVLVSGSAITILAAFFSRSLSHLLFGDFVRDHVVKMCLFLLFVTSLRHILRQYYRITSRISVLSLLEIVESIAETATIYLLVVNRFTVSDTLLSMALLRLLFAIGVVVHISLVANERIRIRIGKTGKMEASLVWPMLVFGVPLIPNSLFRWGVNFADRIIIVQNLDMSSLSRYSAAYSLASVLGILTIPIAYVLYPLLLRLWKENKLNEIQSCYENVTRIYMIIALPACVGITMLSKPLFFHLTGDIAFVDSLFLLEISLGLTANGLFQITAYTFHLSKKVCCITALLFSGLLINVALNALLVPFIGIHGAAISTTVTFISISAISYRYSTRIIKYHICTTNIMKSIFSCAVLSFFIYIFGVDSYFDMILVVIGGAAIYAILVVALGAISFDEFSQLFKAILPLQQAGDGASQDRRCE